MEGAKKVFVFGVDGGTFEVLAPMMEKGLLPHFKRIQEEGSWGTLESTIPPLSPPAWVTFATGKNPGKHGIFGFTEPVEKSYSIRFVNARSRGAQPFWNILSGKGKRVGVINVPMTYPPDPVNGYFISGLDAPGTNSPFTHPPNLYEEICRVAGSYTINYSLPERVDVVPPEKVLKKILEVEENRFRCVEYLMAESEWSLFLCVFSATDGVQHFFWHLMDPRHHRFHKEGGDLQENPVFSAYRKMDEFLGKILEKLDDRTILIVMSDHGAGPFDLSVPYLNLNEWLAERGYLAKTRKEESLFQRGGRWLRSFYRRYLPLKAKETLRIRFGRFKDILQSYLYHSCIDWPKTRAYSSYDELLSRGIRINCKGREPQGIVEPGSAYEELRLELREQLLELVHPFTGRSIVENVYLREELYSGPYAFKAPDLVVGWKPEAFFTEHTGVFRRGKEFQAPSIRRSGEHRREGILMALGPGVRKGRIQGAVLADLAPTILYLMGEAIPGDMDGKLLKDMIEPLLLSQSPPSFEKGGEERVREEAGGTYSDEEEIQIREKLKNLGYID